MINEVNWIIHFVANGACDCGCSETGFLPHACNAHTHGMDQYGHSEFQFVLLLEPKMITYILNCMGLRVQRGERFKAGDIVSEVIEGYNIRLDEFDENGHKVLRVIVPDANGLFPDDPGCAEIYRLQALKTEDLCKSKDLIHVLAERTKPEHHCFFAQGYPLEDMASIAFNILRIKAEIEKDIERILMIGADGQEIRVWTREENN